MFRHLQCHYMNGKTKIANVQNKLYPIGNKIVTKKQLLIFLYWVWERSMKKF